MRAISRLNITSRLARLVEGARGWRGIATAPLSIAFGVCAILVFAGFTVGGLAAAAAWQVELPEASDGVRVGNQLELEAPAWLGRVDSVALYELEFGGDAAASPVPVAGLDPAGGALVRTDGRDLLEPDRSYRLVVEGSVLNLGLGWPEPLSVLREVTFSTQASPKALVPPNPITLEYGEELVVQWDQPLREVELEVLPSAETRVTIPSDDPSQVRIALDDYRDGTLHELSFVEAVGANDVPVQQPYHVTFITPVFPRAAANPDNVVRMGQPLELEWNTPLRGFSVEAPPGVQATTRVGEEQPGLGHVKFEGLAQGQEYSLLVSAAEAANGAPLKEPQPIAFWTPPALEVTEYGPADGSEGVRRDVHPHITFSQPVLNRAAVEHAFQIEPFVPGTFAWESDDTLVYQLEEPFDYETSVTVRVAGGPEGVRGIDRNFLEEDLAFSFVTEKERWIEVNLSQQMLRLVEGSEVVFSTPVATGVRGAETPTGTYTVQYKVVSARFRGTNPSGRTYDIPNVPWVMPFWGDYAIHGAPWRSGFGSPGSNGCISLPAPADRFVYDWADVGTEVRISN